MATEPAPAPRRLWQVPTFLVGLAALLALWYSNGRLRPSVHERYTRAVQALKSAVDRWPPDADQVQAALRKVPDADPPADMLPQVRYLTGSAYVALAEARPGDPDAADWWARARRDLELAADHDLPVQEQKRLRYRLARAWAHIPGTDPQRTILALTQFVSAGDDPSEGHRLLAELHLASSPPNEAKAREALENFLKHASPRADARTLNDVRVRLGELHAKLGEPEKAKRVLERVGPDAPPELYAAAQLMLAAQARADGDWEAADRGWALVAEMKGATDAQQAEARARRPESLIKLGKVKEAEEWVLRYGKTEGPEGRPLLLEKAGLALKDPKGDREEAVGLLEKALAGSDPASVRKLVPAADARRVCEAAFQRAQADGAYDLAVRVAAAYAPVAENGAHHRFRAEAEEAWAAASTGAEAAGHYRKAADAVAAAAAIDTDPMARLDGLRKAAGLYTKAGDREKALAAVGDLVARLTDCPEDRAGQAWVEAGELFQAAGDFEQARRAYQTAAGKTGPARNRARVRYAALAYEADPEQGGAVAVAALEEVAARAPGEDADKGVHEDAVYLLGEIHLMRKAWTQAETGLKSALDAYPDSPRAARGRFQYAQVLRHGAYEAARRIKTDRAAIDQIKAEQLTARQPNLKIDELVNLEIRMERSQAVYEERMRGAYEQFRKAEELLLAAPLTADPAVQRRASFWAADCAFWLGEYPDCAARCEKLVGRYAGRVEELEAVRDLHRCCVFAAEAARAGKDPDGAAGWTRRAVDARIRMVDALRRVPAAEFDGTTDTRKKGYWETWLTENGSPKGGE